MFLIRGVGQPASSAQRCGQVCWREKGYSKQGTLLIPPAWSLITSDFSVSAPVRLNFIARWTYSLVFFLVHVLSHLWVLAHAPPAVPNASRILLYLENVNMSFRTQILTVAPLERGCYPPNLCQVLPPSPSAP